MNPATILNNYDFKYFAQFHIYGYIYIYIYHMHIYIWTEINLRNLRFDVHPSASTDPMSTPAVEIFIARQGMSPDGVFPLYLLYFLIFKSQLIVYRTCFPICLITCTTSVYYPYRLFRQIFQKQIFLVVPSTQNYLISISLNYIIHSLKLI